MINDEQEDKTGPTYPPGFTPSHAQFQTEMSPRRSSVSIRPQRFQTDILILMNSQAGSSSNPGENPVNLAVLDFDEVAEKDKEKE